MNTLSAASCFTSSLFGQFDRRTRRTLSSFVERMICCQCCTSFVLWLLSNPIHIYIDGHFCLKHFFFYLFGNCKVMWYVCKLIECLGRS